MESWMDSWASVFICYWEPVIAAWCRVPTRCMGLIARKACKIISAYLMAWDGLGDCLSFCMASFHIFKRYFNSFWISLLYIDTLFVDITHFLSVLEISQCMLKTRKYDLQLIKLAHDVFSLRQTQELIAGPPQSCVWRQVLSSQWSYLAWEIPLPPTAVCRCQLITTFICQQYPEPGSGPQENGENRFFRSVKSSPSRSVSYPILISINPDQLGSGPPGLWWLCNISHEHCPRARGLSQVPGPHIITDYCALLPPLDWLIVATWPLTNNFKAQHYLGWFIIFSWYFLFFRFHPRMLDLFVTVTMACGMSLTGDLVVWCPASHAQTLGLVQHGTAWVYRQYHAVQSQECGSAQLSSDTSTGHMWTIMKEL